MKGVLDKLHLDPINSGVYINNRWLHGNDLVRVINPSCNQVIADVKVANLDHVSSCINSAAQSYKSWSLVPAPKRAEVIYSIAVKLRENFDLLGALVSLETGKSKAEGNGEVQEMIDMADFAVGQARMLYGKTMPSERKGHRMYEQWHSLGVVLVVTAFNFPVAVWAWNAFLALICGNVVIWKPSAKTPLSAIVVMRICQQVINGFNYDAGIVSLLVSQEEAVINALIDSDKVNLVSFTGSSSVGRQVGVRVAKRMGRSLLELGGNNAAIVMLDADLSQVVPAVLFGAIGTAGQRCTSLRRLFVHKKIYKQVIAELIIAYKQIIVGDPLDKGVHMGPLIDKSAVQNYQQVIAEAESLGAKICIGGKVLPGVGNFVEPTIIEADINLPLLMKESFMPILWLVAIDSLEEAVAYQNKSNHGLSSAIFTKNIKYMEHFLSVVGSDCGIACVNQSTSGAEIGGAFGGEKQTGGGREAGSDSWKAYMRRQTVTINYSNKVSLAQNIDFKSK